MQFYPADWRKDPNVQSLGYFERGVWFEILCLMFESEQRGKLILNGKAMPDEALARLLGLDKQRLTSILTVLLDYGVASRDEQGALMNRRMVKDEELRQVRAACGSMGGNPALMGGGSAGGGGSSGLDKQNGSKSENEDNQKVKQTVTPSSSLSSSASIQRLIDACVREHLGRDPRLVEIAVLETVLRRQGSANEHRPIKSVRYFDEEIGRTFSNKGASALGDVAIDAMLHARRRRAFGDAGARDANV
jgi:hypothetical protein